MEGGGKYSFRDGPQNTLVTAANHRVTPDLT